MREYVSRVVVNNSSGDMIGVNDINSYISDKTIQMSRIKTSATGSDYGKVLVVESNPTLNVVLSNDSLTNLINAAIQSYLPVGSIICAG